MSEHSEKYFLTQILADFTQIYADISMTICENPRAICENLRSRKDFLLEVSEQYE